MRKTPSDASARAGLALAGVLLIGGAVSCGSREGEQTATRAERPEPAAPAVAEPANATPALPTPAGTGFERLRGRWLRPDGGYVLEIRAVSPEGTVDASYLNPRPIRVARADAGREGDALTFFVELRDVNYPGSTYRLVYDSGLDVLAGTYFQAAQQQTYDVSFVRR
jgi:hypothetical protein